MEYRRRTLNTAFDEENVPPPTWLTDYSIEEHTYYQYEGVTFPWRIVCNGCYYSFVYCINSMLGGLYTIFEKANDSYLV
jgi:uncharacterized membrane protein YagU involved in acid resistance